ncbi:D-hexose-6-phosphate mutarotase [Occallatibacter riparius]|uniref:Putative glucose-6-phosphate 1-epimerase n=1 Tax=Occallatibacter riparius TaxID=1002689 RepID=A0A9J7BSC3_9BACT|nr:D-hexose-6-phosphate mutarotase [Occallatibacter riparius]UWZ83941.1 D-hexose-6-phosphate mutarotase [Occallatibacter riparius]
MEPLSHIDALNHRFGIDGIAQIVSGKGGLPVVQITSPAAHAEVSLYGAQVLSWRPAGQEEVLFLSKQSHFESGKAIRGGIPVCFPWFRAKADNPKAPTHGFVRTREWRLDSLSVDDDGSVTLVCLTSSDDSTRALWRHDFLVAYRIRIASTLRLELSVMNRGTSPLRFEEALHSYFRVGDIHQARVHGLDAVTYLDNTDGNKSKRQDGSLALAAPTDNAYIDTEAPAEILDPVLHRRLRTEKLHSSTTIVWNPWQQGAAALSDLGNDEWQHMLCVEAGNILSAAVSLAPGEEHTMRSTLSIHPE